MSASTAEAWLAVVQDGDLPEEQHTELVTLDNIVAQAGGTIELTDGRRITLTAPASETPDKAAAA